ncbi:hypothetical protein A6D6_01952 [Alcanivorax xiamenensis]|uniref:N-methyl-D-aspartate receptor NMDAR2C subunit n=1 Tax=Alcanivorax xiamenensis TaxID=1177156 RepID=A0ABQ6Y8N4_9GAMM|nr:N-methyl-D-aspartate receptor NMDAR2C subunit [Alcanivorax xiamenensis]KAF0805896.1 hypothetical protein A6D6_01952 [Alcanivorax xiamenensis]
MLDESDMNPERWARLMTLWDFGDNTETYRSLVSSYSGKGRYYHSREHVSACLRHLDRCVSEIQSPCEVELALWFHDAIYEPLSGKNEKKSADWAQSFVLENGASRDIADRVHRLIMVTEHNAPAKTSDESLLVDIDLAVLGAEPETYQIFEEGVRSEYKMVPWPLYKKKRVEVLKGFLDRPRIFQNEPFLTEREQQARRNLAAAISKLEG